MGRHPRGSATDSELATTSTKAVTEPILPRLSRGWKFSQAFSVGSLHFEIRAKEISLSRRLGKTPKPQSRGLCKFRGLSRFITS